LPRSPQILAKLAIPESQNSTPKPRTRVNSPEFQVNALGT